MKYKPILEKTQKDVQYLHDLTGRKMSDCLEAIENTTSTVDAILFLLKRGIPLIGFVSKAEKRRFLALRPDWTGICNRLELDTPDNKEIRVLHMKCRSCGNVYVIYVREQDYKDLQESNKAIQDIFPYLTRGERELFLSNICETCFDRIFSEED